MEPSYMSPLPGLLPGRVLQPFSKALFFLFYLSLVPCGSFRWAPNSLGLVQPTVTGHIDQYGLCSHKDLSTCAFIRSKKALHFIFKFLHFLQSTKTWLTRQQILLNLLLLTLKVPEGPEISLFLPSSIIQP